MPEQPDVQSFKSYLDHHALHKDIEHVTVDVDRVLDGIPESRFRREVTHRRFESSRTHGKYLFVELDDGQWLTFHFGMTGAFAHYRKDGDGKPRYAAVTFDFGNDALAYTSRRKLGHVSLIDDPEAFVREKDLGIDIMDRSLTEKRFVEMARESRGAVKCWLMDQSKLAGLGNIYSDEVLFYARIHPKHAAAELDDGMLHHLYRAIHEVLPRAAEADADPAKMPRTWLLPHREKGEQCPRRCGGAIRTLSACGRTSYYCPECQPE